MTIIINLVVALLLGALRLVGHKEQWFQAVATIYVGGLFSVWITTRFKSPYVWLAVALSVLEVLCFLRDKGF